MPAIPYKIKQFAAPGGVWTDIVAPIDCNYWTVKSAASQALSVRSTSADPTTQDTLPGGAQQQLVVARPQNQIDFRYRAGDVVCSVNPAAPDTIVGTFVL